MDLQPTDEQQAIAQALRDFATNEIRPSARESEEAGQPTEAVAKQLFEMGVSTPVPEEFGGQGTYDSFTSVIVAEEVAFGDPGVAFGILTSGLAATALDLAGTPDQRAGLLPSFAEGAVGSIALAERDAGSDPSRLEAEALESGGLIRLSGTKYAVPNALAAAVRLVITKGREHPAIWILPGDAEIVAMPEDKLGLRSARTFKVMLDGLEIPSSSVLGGSAPDPGRIRSVLLRAKLLNAAIAVGLGRASLEYATAYAQDRVAFGKPIGAFQGIAFKIADRAMEIDAARLLVWKAAWAADRDREDADRRVMAACSQAMSAALAAADDGVQILGGHGYMKDHPVEMWYRDAMTLATLDSPSLLGDVYLARAFAATTPAKTQEG